MITAPLLIAAGLPTTGSVLVDDFVRASPSLLVEALVALGLTTEAQLIAAGFATTGPVLLDNLMSEDVFVMVDLVAVPSFGIVDVPTPIGGLEFGRTYFVNVVGNEVTLHRTRGKALAGLGPVEFTPGTGTGPQHSLTYTSSYEFSGDAVNTNNEQIDLGCDEEVVSVCVRADHGFQTGDAVRYVVEGAETATLGEDLTSGATYFVRVDPNSPNLISLHQSRSGAHDDKKDVLTGDGGKKLWDRIALNSADGATRHRLTPTSFGTEAVVNGATLNAVEDVRVIAEEHVIVSADTSWVLNFANAVGTPGVHMEMNMGDTSISGAARASITNGANVTAGNDVTVAARVETWSQVKSAAAETTEADYVEASIEGPETTVTALGGDVDVDAYLDVVSLYAAIIPISGKLLPNESKGVIGGVISFALTLGIKNKALYQARNIVTAHISDATVTAPLGEVFVSAYDNENVIIIADALSLGIKVELEDRGFLAAMATVAATDIKNIVSAFISNSTVTAGGGNVEVDAVTDPTIVVISLGLVTQESTIGLGGSYVMGFPMAWDVDDPLAEIEGTIPIPRPRYQIEPVAMKTVVTAHITDSAVTASNSVIVHALDDTLYVSIVAGATNGSSVGIGAGVILIDVDNEIRAVRLWGPARARLQGPGERRADGEHHPGRPRGRRGARRGERRRTPHQRRHVGVRHGHGLDEHRRRPFGVGAGGRGRHPGPRQADHRVGGRRPRRCRQA